MGHEILQLSEAIQRVEWLVQCLAKGGAGRKVSLYKRSSNVPLWVGMLPQALQKMPPDGITLGSHRGHDTPEVGLHNY